MRRKLAIFLVAFLPAVFAAAQDEPTPPVPQPAITQPGTVTVNYAGPGVTAPTLASSTLDISPPRKCNPYDGIVKLTAVIDENGMARTVNFQSGDERLTNVAIDILNAERFKPGSHNGAPAAVAIQGTIGMQTCSRPVKHADADEPDVLTLRAHPAIAISVLAKPSPPPAR